MNNVNEINLYAECWYDVNDCPAIGLDIVDNWEVGTTLIGLREDNVDDVKSVEEEFNVSIETTFIKEVVYEIEHNDDADGDEISSEVVAKLKISSDKELSKEELEKIYVTYFEDVVCKYAKPDYISEEQMIVLDQEDF